MSESRHFWSDFLGMTGDLHFSPLHTFSYVLIMGGLYLLASSWGVLYKAQKNHKLATTGPYACVRHPQYVAFVLVMLGFLVQWPTRLTLIMFPILILIYKKLAGKEERDTLAELAENIPGTWKILQDLFLV